MTAPAMTIETITYMAGLAIFIKKMGIFCSVGPGHIMTLRCTGCHHLIEQAGIVLMTVDTTAGPVLTGGRTGKLRTTPFMAILTRQFGMDPTPRSLVAVRAYFCLSPEGANEQQAEDA